MELDRLGPEGKEPEFKNENRSLNEEEMDWLLNRLGQDSEINIDESTWSFIAFESIISMFESRKVRGDRRVMIAGNTGLRID